MNELKLQLGHVYGTREGCSRIKIVAIDPQLVQPCVGKSLDSTWSGTFYEDGSYRTDRTPAPFDLVREIRGNDEVTVLSDEHHYSKDPYHDPSPVEHADLIRLALDGVVIQFRTDNHEWYDFTSASAAIAVMVREPYGHFRAKPDVITKEDALQALEDLDDFSRMNTSVIPKGAYETLRRFIEENGK
jgi:hypothetical protein